MLSLILSEMAVSEFSHIVGIVSSAVTSPLVRMFLNTFDLGAETSSIEEY